MDEIIIASKGTDPGNHGNYDRAIILIDVGGWFRLGVQETDDEFPTKWSISRAAAEKLLVALDIMLTNSEGAANSEPQDEPGDEDTVEGHYEGSFGFTKTNFDVI